MKVILTSYVAAIVSHTSQVSQRCKIMTHTLHWEELMNIWGHCMKRLSRGHPRIWQIICVGLLIHLDYIWAKFVVQAWGSFTWPTQPPVHIRMSCYTFLPDISPRIWGWKVSQAVCWHPLLQFTNIQLCGCFQEHFFQQTQLKGKCNRECMRDTKEKKIKLHK